MRCLPLQQHTKASSEFHIAILLGGSSHLKYLVPPIYFCHLGYLKGVPQPQVLGTTTITMVAKYLSHGMMLQVVDSYLLLPAPAFHCCYWLKTPKSYVSNFQPGWGSSPPKIGEKTISLLKTLFENIISPKIQGINRFPLKKNLWKNTFWQVILSIITSPSQVGCHLWVISHIAGCHHGGVWCSWSSRDSTRKMSPAWMIDFLVGKWYPNNINTYI